MNNNEIMGRLMQIIFSRRIIFLFLVFVSIGVGSFLVWKYFTQKAYATWYNASWSYRKAITIHSGSTGVTADQTNFPVAVVITNSTDETDLKTHARADAFDVVFTASDGTTKLPSEREFFNSSTGELEAWVKVPSLSGSVDTVIYMYYGNSSSCDQTLSSCDGTTNKTQVWDSNYKVVWHMNETSGTTVTDSSTVGFNGTKTDATHPAPTTSGQIDGGESWPGTGIIQGSTQTGLPTADYTIEEWVKFTSSSDAWFVLFNGCGTWEHTGTTLKTFETNCNNTGASHNASTSIGTNTWYHIVMTHASNNMKVYINGAQDATTYSDAGGNLSGSGITCGFQLGADNPGGCGDAGLNESGTSDEFRVSNIARSATWIATEYNNQSAPYTFYSVGSETRNGPSTIVFTNSALNVAAGSCTALTVELQTGGVATNPTGTDTLQLSSNSPSGSFSTAADCSGATATLSVNYTTSDTTKTIYYADTRKSASTWTVTAAQTAGPDVLTTGTQNETITAGSVARLVITLPGETFTDGTGNSGSVTAQTAGTSFTLAKISATDSYFNVNTGYSGAKTLVYSGPANAPSGTSPSYTTSVSFTSGQSTTTLTTTLYNAATTTITATDGGSYGYASSSLSVNADSAISAGNSTVAVSPSSVPVNTNVMVTVVPKDSWQNPISGISGTSIVFTGTSATYSTVRNPTTTDTNGSNTYLMWSDIGTKTIVVTVSSIGITQQPTVTVTAPAAANAHLQGGIHLKGGVHVN